LPSTSTKQSVTSTCVSEQCVIVSCDIISRTVDYHGLQLLSLSVTVEVMYVQFM